MTIKEIALLEQQNAAFSKTLADHGEKLAVLLERTEHLKRGVNVVDVIKNAVFIGGIIGGALMAFLSIG